MGGARIGIGGTIMREYVAERFVRAVETLAGGGFRIEAMSDRKMAGASAVCVVARPQRNSGSVERGRG